MWCIYNAIILILTTSAVLVQANTDINLSLHSKQQPNINEDYIVVKIGDKLQIKCEGKYPLLGINLKNIDFDSYDPKMKELRNINWKNGIKWDTNESIIYTPPKNVQNYSFGISLDVLSVEMKHSGWQICFVNEHIYKFLFIFVENRFTASNSSTYQELKLKSNKNITIPCVPPSPDIPVRIQITDYSFQHESLKNVLNTSIYGFDPKIGYKIAPIDDHTKFVCFYSINNVDYSTTVTIIIDDDVNHLTPIINNKYSNIIHLNTDLTMECIFVNSKNLNISLEWTTPNSMITDANGNDIIHYTINLKKINTTLHIASLKVKNVQMIDIGSYTCSIIDSNENAIGFAIREVFIKVNATNKSKPTICETNTMCSTNVTSVSIEENGNYMLKCIAPYPVTWTFKQSEQNNKNPKNIFVYSPLHKNNLTYESILNINMVSYENNGYYYCHERGTSLEDEDVLYRTVFIHMQRGMDWRDIKYTHKLVYSPHEKVSIIYVRKYSRNVTVSCIPLPVNTSCEVSYEEGNIKNITEKPFYKYEILFSKPINEDEILRCACSYPDRTFRYTSNILIKTYESFDENTLPYINLTYNTNVSIGNQLEINCTVLRYCKQCNYLNADSDVSWEYNVNSTNITQRLNITSKIVPLNNAVLFLSTLTINDTRKSDNYEYRCYIENLKSNINVVINEVPDEPIIEYQKYITIITIGVICFILVAIGLILEQSIEKLKVKKNMYNAGVFNFHKGSNGLLNPKKYINFQTDVLPYDKSLEIPRSKIKLEHQLNSGNFGFIFKGQISEQFNDKTVKQVAIKIAKSNMKYTYIKSLIHELKLLSITGNHENIINILGACTDKLNKMELLVIFEYCCHGNIRDYLNKNSNNFKNQITMKPYQVTDTENIENIHILKDNTEHLLGVEKLQEKVDLEYSINTLLSWAYQISCGMDFLSSRKVLHGDLVAKNILLSENNIVKICDFGLSKRIYSNHKEMKELPIKWMAIESIREQIFSTQSDVWSFGVLLWEIFSLGEIPYPNLEEDMNLYKLINNGYRMEQPEYATKELYLLMLKCWEHIPKNRPSFNLIRNFLQTTMESNI